MFSSTLKCKAEVFKFLNLKSVYEELRFHDGSVWKVGLTVEIKLRRRVDRGPCIIAR